MRGVAAGLIGLASLLLSGCAGASNFPPSLFQTIPPCPYGEGRPVMNEFRSDWYSSHLGAAEEPRLWKAAPPNQVGGIGVLRFTWLRSFHAPVIVRLEAMRNGRFRLMAVELSGAGGYGPGRVAREVERRLSADETMGLVRLLKEGGVLDLSPTDDCPVQADGSVIIHGDGAHWIFEANGPIGYRFVDRWSAEGPARELGLHLIGLTGWTYDRVY